MIRVSGLVVRRGGAAICRVASLEVAAGERVVVLGDNGSGKTTLLRVLADLERPQEGEVAIAAPRLERTLVHQTPYLFRGAVLRNLELGLRARGLGGAARRERLAPLLDALGLDDLGRRRAADLSGGERRRVALARALALEPRLLLLDEPGADLDTGRASAFLDLLAERPRTTVVTASPRPLAAPWGDTRLVLRPDTAE